MPNHLPYVFENKSGELIGFDIEMANQLALDLDVGLERIVGLVEDEVGLAPLEERGEDLPEVRPDLLEGLPEELAGGRNFGHLAYAVEDIYALCQKLADGGVTINRPPRDGHMAFVRSPDGISIELLQEGEKLPVKEPWASMENKGTW